MHNFLLHLCSHLAGHSLVMTCARAKVILTKIQNKQKILQNSYTEGGLNGLKLYTFIQQKRHLDKLQWFHQKSVHREVIVTSLAY